MPWPRWAILLVRTRALSLLRSQWAPTFPESGSIGVKFNEGGLGKVELYETFHVIALDTFILRGKRNNLAEMRKMTHDVIGWALLRCMEEIKVVMKFVRADKRRCWNQGTHQTRVYPLFVLFVEIVVTLSVLPVNLSHSL